MIHHSWNCILVLLLLHALAVTRAWEEEEEIMMTTPWEKEPVTGIGAACPLNYIGNDEWLPANDICYRFMPLPLNWRHSDGACHDLGTPSCPAELLRLEHASAVIDLELDKGGASVFPDHRPIRLGARFVSYGETWIEGGGETAPPFPVNHSLSSLAPYHFEGLDGETASLAFPAGWICGGTSFAEKHVFVCQSCSNETRDANPPPYCNDSCGDCDFEAMAEECPAYSGYCQTREGDCLLKHEAPGYEEFFSTGDPCFLYDGNRVCITSLEDGVAKVTDCNCFDSFCGCDATRNEHACLSPQGECMQRADVPEEYQELYTDGDTSCFENDREMMCIFAISESGAALTSECDCFQPACSCGLPKCETAHGRCLNQEQVGRGYEELFASGDPCFWNPDFQDSVCVVDFNGEGVAQVASCDCADFACGCRLQEGEELPQIESGEREACDMLIPELLDCSEDQNFYCKRPYSPRKGPKHTLCLYCTVDMTICGQFCSRGISGSEIRFVVDLHNTVRADVANDMESRGLDGPQPGASNMNQLQWDTELAKTAQMWADQCQEGMDENRVTEPFLDTDGRVGQNMASIWTAGNLAEKQFRGLVEFWVQEVENWPSANLASYSTEGVPEGLTTQHYTQIVWAETTKIGCGFVSRIDEENLDYPFKQTLVCNYGTGGNVEGSSVYLTGELGADCPNGHLHGLCIPDAEE